MNASDKGAWEVLHSSESNEWRTPPEVFNWLDAEFRFVMDAACTAENSQVRNGHSLTAKLNALEADWGKILEKELEDRVSSYVVCKPPGLYPCVFLNPPYGRSIGKWIDKAWEESQKGMTVVVLTFACTDTEWWSRAWGYASQVWFLKGRIKFLNPDGEVVNSAPKGSAVLIFDGQRSRPWTWREPPVTDWSIRSPQEVKLIATPKRSVPLGGVEQAGGLSR